MENYFSQFRKNIIGIDKTIKTQYHDAIKIVYTDWTASGRNYTVIEEKLQKDIMPMVANTHTETDDTGMAMTYAYHKAKEIIKKHVNANDNDVLISSGSGMTGVINKLQRILGLRIHEKYRDRIVFKEDERPIIFVSHMEHHSNQTNWLETIAEVKIVEPDETGLVSVNNFRKIIKQYAKRKTKIVSITACSNVTGIITPYHKIAKIIHEYKGFCMVDFACSASYVNIDMHPLEKDSYLDAIFFSPHKFLGGPGSSGIMVFNKKLYDNKVPDNPGGGTVEWTNPWGEHTYIDDIETREDGGTPPFLQTIKAAMCLKLKERMGVDNIIAREEEILEILWSGLTNITGLHVLAGLHTKRLGVISFYIDGLHYNVGVKMLNDKFGIQTRGGCSCAGTYGHYLLNVNPKRSHDITQLVSQGNCSTKPGWIRLSIHPTHTDEEIKYVINCIKELSENHKKWITDYNIDFIHNQVTAKDNSSEIELKKNINLCLLDNFT